tara:strand:+ start:1305 stop:1559 length:255 start_codon:yes stop_codon:yes gene_type:complete
MPRELTGTEMQAVWEKYLGRESETHKRDIQRAEGKVTEIDELLNRVRNTCKFCGEYIYNYSDVDRMAEHVTAKHLEPEPELSQG